MLPIEVFRSQKEIGVLNMSGNNQFLDLPLKIAGKPIIVTCKGVLNNPDEPLYTDQFGKLKIIANVESNGDLLLLNTHLIKVLADFLENESLPDYKPIVKGFLYNERIYTVWPTYKKSYVAVLFHDGTEATEVSPASEEGFKKMQESLKKHGGKELTLDVELSCWARRDVEKGELVIGISPRISNIQI